MKIPDIYQMRDQVISSRQRRHRHARAATQSWRASAPSVPTSPPPLAPESTPPFCVLYLGEIPLRFEGCGRQKEYSVAHQGNPPTLFDTELAAGIAAAGHGITSFAVAPASDERVQACLPRASVLECGGPKPPLSHPLPKEAS